MSATPFTEGVTPINTDWLNDVNTFLHTLLSNPTTLYALFKLGINRAYAEYATNTDLTTVIPGDDTIPQNTEGTQILSVSITPRNTAARIRLRFQAAGATNIAGGMIAALFKDSGADALKGEFISTGSSGAVSSLLLEHEDAPATISAVTYKIRVGPISGVTARLNGTTGGRFLGGVMAASLVAEEILV